MMAVRLGTINGGEDGAGVASWKSEDCLLDLIARRLAGELDQSDWARSVEPKLETAGQHKRCHLWA